MSVMSNRMALYPSAIEYSDDFEPGIPDGGAISIPEMRASDSDFGIRLFMPRKPVDNRLDRCILDPRYVKA